MACKAPGIYCLALYRLSLPVLPYVQEWRALLPPGSLSPGGPCPQGTALATHGGTWPEPCPTGLSMFRKLIVKRGLAEITFLYLDESGLWSAS